MIILQKPETVGKFVKRQMMLQNKTLKDLAAGSGTSGPTIGCWTNGRTMPSVAALIPVLETLGFELAIVPAKGKE